MLDELDAISSKSLKQDNDDGDSLASEVANQENELSSIVEVCVTLHCLGLRRPNFDQDLDSKY